MLPRPDKPKRRVRRVDSVMRATQRGLGTPFPRERAPAALMEAKGMPRRGAPGRGWQTSKTLRWVTTCLRGTQTGHLNRGCDR